MSPYIKKERRGFAICSGGDVENPGELNYLLTMHILSYLKCHGKSYATLNEILGVLTAVRSEFWDRVVRPYEDKKKEANGDVYNE